MSDNYERLKELKINEKIFVIYIVISIAAIISNNIEEKSIMNEDKDIKLVTNIRSAIIIASILIYLYFLYKSYKNYKNTDDSAPYRQKKANKYALISSILFLVAAIIVFYVNLLNIKEEIDFL